MEITKLTDPWPYTEIKNYFSNDEYRQVMDFIGGLGIVNPTVPINGWWKKNKTREQLIIRDDLPIQGEKGQNTFLSGIQEFYDEDLNNIFIKRFGEYLDTIGLDYQKENIYMQFQIHISPPEKNEFDLQMIHCDHPSRICTCVIHLTEVGTGTELYSDQGIENLVKITNWIPNGGNGWTTTESGWHRVTNQTSIDRFTLRCFLFDRNVELPNGLVHGEF
jgi:hypothetical protein